MAIAFASWIKTQYDKLIAVLVLVGLLASILILAVRLGGMKADRATKEKEIAAIEIKFPALAPQDMSIFGQTEAMLKKPFQMTNGLETPVTFVPETRVWCVKTSCGKPIPLNAKSCPACGAPQPDDPEASKDADDDGMDDDWERLHGLSAKDPADAALDADGDGFSNVQEFKGNSDPKNKVSQPDYEDSLRVQTITPKAFELIFKGTTTSTNGVMTFQVNLTRGGKTYFCKMGESVEGFKLVKYEPRSVTNTPSNATTPRVTDVSVLTVQRGEKKIALERNQFIKHHTATTKILFVLDNSIRTVALDDTFAVSWKEKKVVYRIINVDSKSGNVTLQRVSDRKEFVVSKSPAGKGDASESN